MSLQAVPWLMEVSGERQTMTLQPMMSQPAYIPDTQVDTRPFKPFRPFMPFQCFEGSSIKHLYRAGAISGPLNTLIMEHIYIFSKVSCHKFGHPARSSEFYNHAISTEFVVTVGMLRKR